MKTRKQLPPLPEEIIQDILKRLPVRSLVRFSCTCKRWRSLIFSDPKFNKAHIHHARRPSWKFQEITCSRSFKRTVDCDSNIATLLPKETLTCPVVLSSCNGLLFVHHKSLSVSKERGYGLWNPYTNSVRRILDGGLVCRMLCGLSYDHASDDYKAVLNMSSPHVFSLRRNSWKKLSDLTFEIPNMDLGYDQFGITPDNGMCYWQIKVNRSGSSIIICFDSVMEKFKEVPLPDEWCSSPTSRLFQIGVLDGCLSRMDIFCPEPLSRIPVAFISTIHGGDRSDRDPGRGLGQKMSIRLSLIHINIIWVMKEYGFWTKMHVLELNYIERMGEINTYKPLGYNSTKDQVVMIARVGRHVWHFRIADVNNGVLRKPTDGQFERLLSIRYIYIVPYTESLLCPWLDLDL